jgi:cytochrome b561
MQKYTSAQRFLHWSMAVLILGLMALGYYMSRYIQPDTDLQITVYYIHISFAVIVLALLFARIAARMVNGAPPLPEGISSASKVWSKIAHLSMYMLIGGVILSGWFKTEAQGYPVKLFGLEFPPIFAKRDTFLGQPIDPLLDQIHMSLAYLLGAIVAVHVFAVIQHRRKDGVNLLDRMR